MLMHAEAIFLCHGRKPVGICHEDRCKNTLFPGEVQHQTKGFRYDDDCLRMGFKPGHER